MKQLSTIYIDHQASTPITQEVLEAMQECWQSELGNPHSSEHVVGIKASKLIDRSQQAISKVLSCEPDEVIFNSGASEGNNQAIFGVLNSNQLSSGKRRVIISAIEHKCVISAARFWCDKLNLDLQIVRVDQDGYVDQEHLQKLLGVPTILVSIMAVNNEVGTIQDLKSLSEIIWAHDSLFHSDCAQLMMASEQLCAPDVTDICTFSGHKIGASQGVGCLFISAQLHEYIVPIIHGGGQQGGLRAGTQPTPLIVGLGKAFEAFSDFQANKYRIINLRKKTQLLLDKISSRVRDVELNGPALESRHPGNLNLFFKHCNSDMLLAEIFSEVAASSGSACSSGAIEVSHVLTALGYSQWRASRSIRLSPSLQNHDEDLDLAATKISNAATKILHSSNNT